MLSNPEKRAAYDLEGDIKLLHADETRSFGNRYQRKNPEFDPNFDHFQNMSEYEKNFGMKEPFKASQNFGAF